MEYRRVMNIFVAERCADIRREVESFRLMNQTRPDVGWFGHRMLSLGLWLVAVGERLCQRYDVSERKTILNEF
jgi:hypothetical protein